MTTLPVMRLRPAAERAWSPRWTRRFVAAALLAAGITVFPAPVVRAEVPTFERHVMPMLTARGCNAGGCHGKSGGQNGFALSLLGFDPEGDYRSLVMQSRGRRVNPSAPDESLLLRKGTGHQY